MNDTGIRTTFRARTCFKQSIVCILTLKSIEMIIDIRFHHMKIKVIGTIIITIVYLTSCTVTEKSANRNATNDEAIYLTQLRNDFISHKEDVIAINTINRGIVMRIDSLFNGARKDSRLLSGIMNTRAYNLTILAYKNILNGNYIKNAQVKLNVARHIARFEGIAHSKELWDEQWDKTARPYIYNNGMLKSSSQKTNLISDSVFRAVLWDRRMFAHDVEICTPIIISSADSIIVSIDAMLKK